MLEIEIKLPFTQPDDADHFHRLDLLQALPHETQQLHTTYFDTPNAALRNKGIAFRIRKCGDLHIQTIKAAATHDDSNALQKRQEWESIININQPQLAQIPSEDVQLQLQQLIGDQPLLPIFETIFTRDLWTYQTSASETIEIALDRGKIVCQNSTLPICELELELKHGNNEHSLQELAQQFAQQFPFSNDASSKAKRGYLLAAQQGIF